MYKARESFYAFKKCDCDNKFNAKKQFTDDIKIVINRYNQYVNGATEGIAFLDFIYADQLHFNTSYDRYCITHCLIEQTFTSTDELIGCMLPCTDNIQTDKVTFFRPYVAQFDEHVAELKGKILKKLKSNKATNLYLLESDIYRPDDINRLMKNKPLKIHETLQRVNLEEIVEVKKLVYS
jgi:hypothetical protein